MMVKELQELMRELYYEKDRERGTDKTLNWLSDEVKELFEAIQKNEGRAIEEEIADVLAWTISVANLCGVDVEEAVKKKYPRFCRYCGKSPCSCKI